MLLTGVCRWISRRKLILHDPKHIEQLHSRAPQLPPPTHKPTRNASFTCSLIGLPNSGKSTLFNVLAGQRLALTDSIPGMTRDRKQTTILNGLLRIIDTAGVQSSPNPTRKQLHRDMLNQTLSAYHQSDLILLIVDSKKGITSEEINFVEYLRKLRVKEGDEGEHDNNNRNQKKKKVILVANKCEGLEEHQVVGDLVKLGIPEMCFISAERGDGVLELLQKIDQEIPREVRDKVETSKQKRKQAFQRLTQQMKVEVASLGEQVSIRQWEKQFRRLNPNPQDNSELDQDTPNPQSFTKPQQTFTSGRGTSQKNPNFKKPIHICIVGRPNVGKSSLINHLLQTPKLLVSQHPHTTRDSISCQWQFNDRKIHLIDTAGLSSTNFDRNLQHLKKVQVATMNHVKFSHVVVYLLDALTEMKQEDFVFIRRILQEGRAVVLAVNKWEVVKREFRGKVRRWIQKQVATHLGEMNSPRIAFASAKTQEGVQEMMEQVLETYDKWNRRISTGMLNDWLRKFKKLDNLPVDSGNELKIRYIVQAKVRPPTFVIFVNNKELFKANYLRFLRANLVQEFNLQGTAVRIILKTVQSTGNQATKKARKNPLARQRKQFMKKVKRQERLLDLKMKFGDFGVKRKEKQEKEQQAKQQPKQQ